MDVTKEMGQWMTPAVTASVVTGLTQVLARLPQDKQDAVLKIINDSTGMTFASIGPAARWIVANPAKVWVILAGIMRFGPDVWRFIKDHLPSYVAEKLGAASKDGPATPSGSLNLNDAKDALRLRELINWARSHYGSAQGAIAAHDLNAAFLALPRDTMLSGFKVFTNSIGG